MLLNGNTVYKNCLLKVSNSSVPIAKHDKKYYSLTCMPIILKSVEFRNDFKIPEE